MSSKAPGYPKIQVPDDQPKQVPQVRNTAYGMVRIQEKQDKRQYAKTDSQATYPDRKRNRKNV